MQQARPSPFPAAGEHSAAGLWLRAHRMLALLLCLLTIQWTQPAIADPARVQVLLSDSGGAYSELIDALQERLEALAPGRVELRSGLAPRTSSDAQDGGLFDDQSALVVAIGLRASALAVESNGNAPVLSLLVPYDSYTALNRAAGTPHSAIFLDQPLGRQLDLLQLLLPNARRVAALAGPTSAARAAELRDFCNERGMRLAVETVTAAENPVPAITRLMDHAEVLLALPDPAVFNRDSLQAILLTTYRSGVPVLGFSQAYVRAGALAAVHSSAAQIGTHAGEWIAELANAGEWRLGEPRYPAYYSVAVNAQVAQTLGIKAADESVLLEKLRDLDRKRHSQHARQEVQRP